jgi:hypothetical protein
MDREDMLVNGKNIERWKPIRFGIFSEPFPTTRGLVKTIILAQCSGRDYADAQTKLMKLMEEANFESHNIKSDSEMKLFGPK